MTVAEFKNLVITDGFYIQLSAGMMAILPGRFAIVTINPTDTVTHGVRMLKFGNKLSIPKHIEFLKGAIGETPAYASGTHQVILDFLGSL